MFSNDEETFVPEVFPDLSFDVRSKGVSLFREWQHSAMRFIPEAALEPRNVSQAPRALQRAIMQGLKSISETQPQLRDNMEWCVGFLQGFIGSTLSVHWTLCFAPKSEAYRHALWLKATIILMENEPEFIQKVNRLYTYLQDANFPISDADYDLSEEEAVGHRALADLTTEDNWETHKPYLEDLLHNDFTETLESQ